jgi:signal transduction histidine kinase
MKNPLDRIISREQARRMPLLVSLGYAAAAVCWIVLSDLALSVVSHVPAPVTIAEVAKGLAFVAVTSTALYLVLRRYLQALLHRDTVLTKIAEGVSATTGDAFFASLVQRLAETIGSDYAVVGELDPHAGTSVRTIAVFANGQMAENFEYQLAGTPCADVHTSGFCAHTHGVRERFPHDPLLQQMEVDAYLGIPLRSAAGQTMGLISVMSRTPIRNPELAESVFAIFATRAAAELERKRSEKNLLEQFQQTSMIFDSLNAVVYVADLQTHRLMSLNSFGSSIFGTAWEGRPFYKFLQLGGSTVIDICPSDRLAMNGQPLHPCVWEFQHNGTGRWYQCIDRAIRWTDGSLVRMGIAMDITETRKLDQLKEEMLSAVSHEMRTPLTAIIGFTEYLQNQATDEQERLSCLNTIHQESERLNGMIGNFLQLQRLHARVDVALVKAVSVNELLLSAKARYAAADRRITVSCPDDLPPLSGNPDHLHEMMENLVSNAVKFSPEGSDIEIGAERVGNLVIIRIRDHGIGIPPELHERIFEKFFRADNSDRRLTGGTGLGLALVKEIVALHGGSIRVESAPGRGSSFLVTLPLCPLAVASEEQATPAP